MTRPCNGALQALLDNWGPLTELAICDLYTFTLAGGEVLRYSGWQKALSAPAPATDTPLLSFTLGPPIKRNKTKFEIGVQVDELDLEVYAAADEIVFTGGALTWQAALHYGLFDGAYLDMWRCFMSPAGSVVGTIKWFYGRVADVDIGRTKISIKVKSLLDLLTQQMPRRLYQAACTHVFGDQMCGFDRSTLSLDISAETGTLASQIYFTAGSPSFSPSTLYDNGTLTCTSGANIGYRRSITQVTGGVIYLLEPWIFPIVIGDGFQLLPGCDHTIDTCDTVFANLARFGGFPDIPPPENAV